jgi:hypothetical protein
MDLEGGFSHKHGLRMYVNKTMRIFAPKREEAVGGCIAL